MDWLFAKAARIYQLHGLTVTDDAFKVGARRRPDATAEPQISSSAQIPVAIRMAILEPRGNLYVPGHKQIRNQDMHFVGKGTAE